MCLEQEQQKHKSRFKNTKLKSKNHKPKNTNTNPAIDQPNQTQKLCIGSGFILLAEKVVVVSYVSSFFYHY